MWPNIATIYDHHNTVLFQYRQLWRCLFQSSIKQPFRIVLEFTVTWKQFHIWVMEPIEVQNNHSRNYDILSKLHTAMPQGLKTSSWLANQSRNNFKKLSRSISNLVCWEWEILCLVTDGLLCGLKIIWRHSDLPSMLVDACCMLHLAMLLFVFF